MDGPDSNLHFAGLVCSLCVAGSCNMITSSVASIYNTCTIVWGGTASGS